MTLSMSAEVSYSAPPHFDLLVALASKGVCAMVVTTLGGTSQVRVVKVPRQSDPDTRVALSRPSRAGFPIVHLATAHAAGHVVEAGDITRYALTSTGRAIVRRWRASIGAARAAMSAMDGDMAAIVAPPPGGGKPAVNDSESPLLWLSKRLDRDRRPLIDAVQLAAGDRLRADLYLAHLTPRTTQSWSGIPQSRGERRGAPAPASSMSDNTVAARQRVAAALDSVGREAADMLIDVCGHLIGLEEIEKRHAWPARSAKLILQAALNALARHYGMLPRTDMVELAERKLRHWGAADYRPALHFRRDET
jgi:hypothetical protein